MTVVLATTFTKALRKLTEDERKQSKITALDVQTDPDSPGLSLHRIDRARDPNFWSARVNRDLRLILHKANGSTCIAYVGHHDDAYAWAERRRIEAHPSTGAMQIVELRERVEDIVVHRVVDAELPPVLANYDAAAALSWGVPEDWVEDVLTATDDTVLDVAAHLPEEAAEAVLRAASGEAPIAFEVATEAATGLDHPDAKRRFRLIGDQAELAAALDAPWDEWTIFLHPAQREFADRDFAGPARVVGTAGTGKTVVALHRAVRLAREGGRVLLSTFSPSLVSDLDGKVDRLAVGVEWRSRIEVATLRDMVADLLPTDIRLATSEEVDAALSDAAATSTTTMSSAFLKAEWRVIVDAWGVPDAKTYRELPRLGRGARLPASRRDAAWAIFADARAGLQEDGLTTDGYAMHDMAERIRTGRVDPAIDHVVVDEAQDISPAELVLLAAIASDRVNGLFFAGDIGQRIFRAPFPWSRTGVDVRGRSRMLKVNYRTSHEIKMQTEELLPRRLVEADGAEEDRGGVTSVFHGPQPSLRVFPNDTAEAMAAAEWFRARRAEGAVGARSAILVRSTAQFGRGRAIVERLADPIPVLAMHDAKGREFKAVLLIACDGDVIPSEDRLLGAEDERAMAEVFETERHLLYVAATRAREHLWISGVEPASEFLTDLRGSSH